VLPLKPFLWESNHGKESCKKESCCEEACCQEEKLLQEVTRFFD
jgi:hypothetical protein